MAKIKGVPVTLYEQTVTGYDAFGAPIYEETPVTVDNVLVAPLSDQEILNSVDLYGRKAVYTLAIPKGDTHDWVNKHVTALGIELETFGEPLIGIECDIPLEWNKKVKAAIYE